jgi:hypothetical protein
VLPADLSALLMPLAQRAGVTLDVFVNDLCR